MSENIKQKFKRFGKYLLLDHIVDGGMAKICRARYLGEQANKIVAIKMVQPQFSQDPAFKQMFEDELQVAFGLIHPNIAQTYDYGIVDSQLYAAMEFVDGANLKQYMDRLKKRNFVFPVEITSYIASQVCQALHYAHTFTDKLTGQSLNIIHRDISPHNIMLTYDGSVKVIDFGIAKAETNSEATQAGTIKGKLAYLAPEYLEGLELDCRYDVFAVGITFWELLCNRRLFQAKNDLAVLKKIQNCEIPPPSSINPNVSKELDAIVLKALSKDRNERYENMDKFNRAVVRFLYSTYPEFNATDLSYFANELFKEDIKADRKKLVNYGKIDIKPYLKELKLVGEHGIAPAIPSDEVLSPAAAAAHARKAAAAERVELDFNEEHQATVIGLNIAHTGLTSTKQLHGSSRSTHRSDKTRTTINRSVPRKGLRTKKKNNLNKIFGVVAVTLAALIVYKSGIINKMTKAPLNQELVKSSSLQKETTIVYLDGHKPLMTVFIDGEEVEYSDFSGLSVPTNKKIKISVQQSGKLPFDLEVKLAKSDEGKTFHIPELGAGEYGLLTTSRNFPIGSRLQFLAKGKRIDKKLPVENMRVPAGKYQAFIIDPVMKTKKKVQIEIEASKKTFLRN